MKKEFTKLLALTVALLFVLPLIPFTGSAVAATPLFHLLPDDNPGLNFTVESYEKTATESYMFLPNTQDATSVMLRYDEEFTSVTGSAVVEWDAEEKYFVVDTTIGTTVEADDIELIFMQSSLPSMNIVINEGESIDTINADKEAKIGAKVAIDGADNDKYNLEYTDIQLKTRGNTTFWPDKKPYQIKFDSKQNLFGMGKAKKWILLANYYDGTSIRTKVFFDLADEIGLDYTSKSVFVDLYIDGDYRGVYQLIEKIEIGSTRVDLNDEYGVILEMESNIRTDVINDIFFTTNITEKDFIYKDYVYDFEDTSTPERRQHIFEIKRFVEGRINGFESAMYDDEPDWDTISSMIDVDSFALYYLLCEYCEQVDCTLASTYFYLDGPGDVIHCGPVWDFDRACGFNDPIPNNTDFIKNILDYTDGYRVEWFKELFRSPEFVARVNELYEERAKAAFDTAKVMNAIDTLQAQLMPSLIMNHVKWVVFYDREYTADELVFTGTVDRIAYTTNHIKGVLTNKKAYMDVAYGEYMPTVSFVTYNTSGVAQSNYTGGCMTPEEVPLGGLSVELIDSIFDGRIDYRLRIDRDQTDVASDGAVSATQSFQRANGIYILLVGNVANYFTIQYRVHLGGRWSSWASDGSLCGRTSSGGGQYYVDRIQVRLVKKQPVTFASVNYVADGFDTVNESVVAGNAIYADRELSKLGYDFTGWYTDPGCTIPFEDGTEAVSGETYTLYAGFVAKPQLFGDLDGDGKINVNDLSLMKGLVVGAYTVADVLVDNADINGDGKITTHDLKLIKKLIAGQEIQ